MVLRPLQFVFSLGRDVIRVAMTLAFVVGLFALAPSAHAEAPNGEKLAQLKAAFILNFIRLSEWPASAFASESDPLVVAVVGDRDLVPYLERTLKDQVSQGHAIVLKRHAFPAKADEDEQRAAEAQLTEDLRAAHVAAFSGPSGDRVAPFLAALERRPLLTVGDGGDYAERGAMLALQLEGDKMVFFASRDALGRSGVKVSANLLRLARIKSKDKR